MLRTEGDRSSIEWRWPKPSTSISILRLRMRLRYPLMRLRHPTRGCPVYKVLLNLDPNKAPGPDGLPTIVLKTWKSQLTLPNGRVQFARGWPKFQTRSPNGRLKLLILRLTSDVRTTKFPAHCWSALLKRKRKTFGRRQKNISANKR